MATLHRRAASRRHWPPGVPDPWRLLEGGASGLLALVLLLWGLPSVAGADWAAIGHVLGAVGPLQLAGLAGVWALSLWVHAVALAAAMPGLGAGRAMFLNVTGSAVSNLLPLGGAAGTALNYSTSRAWGFSTAAFLRWALVTNIWDTLGKLVIPAVALLWLVVDDTDAPDVLVSAALGSTAVLAAFVGLVRLGLRHDGGAAALGRALDWLAARLRPRRRAARPYAVVAVEFRRRSSGLVATAWPRLTVGKTGFAVAQALLLWLCLTWLGGAASLAVVFAAFAAERVLSMAVVTPGAAGVVEVGMTGVLVILGVDPAVAAAAVLLYRAFVVGLEIPVGGAALLWWLIGRGHTRVPVGAVRVTRPG